MARKKADNFLDYIPKHNTLYEYRTNDKGLVEVKVVNKGMFNRIAQIFFKRPKISWIELPGMGSFIWNQIDGKRNVYEIGQLLSAAYGKKAEPLYERLCTFIKSLHNSCFIVYENKK
jgi:hypothetical protein